ncbi:hypothetical protein J5N97_008960 [Dioscorea zingiberensis]|uniref:Classical arabinogalactan protein 26-like n=1 Tax=Dioscorea zingiberensis TaxID=325984 RepID=A0A9D5CVH2_9LILI|nr:hypothetical protein J5N97_008960 [Dioscorea zingiberensis]
MATSSTQLFSFMLTTTLLSTFTSSFCSISTSPSFLPSLPYPSSSSSSLVSPALAPDIMPVFPTPGGATPKGALPIIPSSQSPPNPDVVGPESAITPSSLSTATSTAKSSVSHPNLLGTILLLAILCMFHSFSL